MWAGIKAGPGLWIIDFLSNRIQDVMYMYVHAHVQGLRAPHVGAQNSRMRKVERGNSMCKILMLAKHT